MLKNTNSLVSKFANTTIKGFPKGVAYLSYYDESMTMNSNGDGTVALTKVWTPMNFQKSQRLGIINMNGRNTPVIQAMGGNGLTYPDVNFTLKDETKSEINNKNAHKTVLTIAGWCDAGVPLFFMFDEWIRRVMIQTFNFQEVRYHTWYKCDLTLLKYEPITPLVYERTILDLAPFPEMPNPIIPTDPDEGGNEDGGGNGAGDISDPSNPPIKGKEWDCFETNDSDFVKTSYCWKKKDAVNADCIEHVIQEGESIYDIIQKYYTNLSTVSSEFIAVYCILVRLNKDKRKINLPDFTEGHIGGDYPFENLNGIPKSKKTICVPRKIKIGSGNEEKIVEGNG